MARVRPFKAGAISYFSVAVAPRDRTKTGLARQEDPQELERPHERHGSARAGAHGFARPLRPAFRWHATSDRESLLREPCADA